MFLLAHTKLVWQNVPSVGYTCHEEGVPTEADELAEIAGRACYQSNDRPNSETADNDSYLSNILRQRHFSVLEHASATLYADGVSRSFLAEITRHRHLSFSVMSQRYVDESKARMIYPPALKHDRQFRALDVVADKAREQYRLLVEDLVLNYGLTRKQAREAARAVLPNATETKLIITGNLRTWREVIEKRISPHADAEMQLFAQEALRVLKNVAPSTFQDMSVGSQADRDVHSEDGYKFVWSLDASLEPS